MKTKSTNSFLGKAGCLLILSSLFMTGCRVSFSSMDGYSFDFKGSEAERQESEAIGDIEKLTIDNRFGQVHVEKTDAAAGWDWNVKCWSDSPEEAEAYTKLVKLNSTVVGNQQTIEITLPDAKDGFRGLQSDLVVKVPADVEIKINNTFGPSIVKSMDSEISVTNRHGDISLAECSNNSSLNTSHGKIDCTNIGSSTIENHHGNVTLKGSTGDIEVAGSHTNISASEIGGNLKVDTTHTSISGNYLKGNVEVSATHDDVQLTDVGGDLNLDVHHGDARVLRANGNVNAEMRHGDVDLLSNGGSINIDGQHSGVRITVGDKPFNLIDVRTTHDDVTIHCTDTLKPTLKLEAEHGKVNADMSQQSGEGMIKVQTRHGDISIKKVATTSSKGN